MKRSKPLTRGKPLRRGKPLARGQPLKHSAKPMQRGAKLKARKVPRAFRQRRDPQYADWIRTQMCLLAGRKITTAGLVAEGYFVNAYISYWHSCPGPVQACHVKSRGSGGDDRANLWPGCGGAHDEQHRIGLTSFERRWGIDLKAAAADLWAQYQRETGAP